MFYKNKIKWRIDALLQRHFPENWTRVVMYEEIRKTLSSLDCGSFDTLEISGKNWADAGFNSYRNVSYPEFDICKETVKGQQYDLIIAEQVFEHLKYPYRAIKNVYSMLKPNGYFLISTPFLIRLHGSPMDCSRWSEDGMKYFLEEGGFELGQIQTGSWGNRRVVKAHINNRKKWTRRYIPWLHSLENQPEFPVTVWAFARRTG